MSSVSLPRLNFFSNFLTPEEAIIEPVATTKQGLARIVSIKSPVKKNEEMHIINTERNIWHFLTLGIPSLIETLSLFFSDLVHRETLDFPWQVRFKYQRLPSDKVGQLNKFQQFNQISSKPFNEAAQNKALQIMYQLINKIEDEKNKLSQDDLVECEEKLKSIREVISKNAKGRTTRTDFNESDWKIADLIDFEIAKEYFEELTALFNAEWMNSSELQNKIKTEFGLNYHEAVVAESLALALSYIEGLEDKSISLPYFDPLIGKYESIVYKIKVGVLGDSLPYYVLESENPAVSPWLVIRGTQPYIKISPSNKEYRTGGLESILADALDPECISRNVVNKSLVTRPIVNINGKYIQKESLSDLFMQWDQKEKIVNLAGHSLGGTIVNALAVEFCDQIKTAYAFSAAGVSKETGDRWDNLKNSFPNVDFDTKLVNLDYEGDIVPSGGFRLIGNHFALKPLIQSGPNGMYDCHVRSHLNQNFEIQKIDVQRESNKLARIFCEKLRMITGRCFLLLLSIFNRKHLPNWWKNRHIYRERADFERKVRPYYKKAIKVVA